MQANNAHQFYIRTFTLNYLPSAKEKSFLEMSWEFPSHKILIDHLYHSQILMEESKKYMLFQEQKYIEKLGKKIDPDQD